MLYKLSIKPTRLELLKLIALDKSTYKEIRVAVRPLPFRFNRGIIDSTEFFQQFVDILNDFLETYRQDISELFISLKEHYFQVQSLPLQESTDELLHWEITQYITDDPSSYKFGTYAAADEQKIFLVIARTKLIEYFQKVIKSLNGTVHFTALGFDLKSTKNETIFIKADREIADFYRFGYAGSWSPDNETVETKKVFPKALVLGFSITALVIVTAIWIWPQISTSEKSADKSAATVQTAAKQPVAAIDSSTADAAQVTTPQTPAPSPAGQSDIYSTLSSLTSLNFKTLVINNSYLQIELLSAPDADKAIETLKSISKNSTAATEVKIKNVVTYNLTDLSYFQQNSDNQQKFTQLLAKNHLSNKFNYALFNDAKSLNIFLADLKNSNLKFSHLILSHRGGIYSLALEFL